jgi:hypothetical protein
MRAGGKLDAAQATALLAETRAALLTIKPAYDRGIAWAQADMPTAPSGRVGALTLPDGARPILERQVDRWIFTRRVSQ